jgi:hypothetical protein
MASSDSQVPVNLLALGTAPLQQWNRVLISHRWRGHSWGLRTPHTPRDHVEDSARPCATRPSATLRLLSPYRRNQHWRASKLLELILRSLIAQRLIALMIGRLRMNTKEALEQYNTIAGKIFSNKNKKYKHQDGTFKASTLEVEMKRVVATHSNGNNNLRMLDEALIRGTSRVYDFLILKRREEVDCGLGWCVQSQQATWNILDDSGHIKFAKTPK